MAVSQPVAVTRNQARCRRCEQNTFFSSSMVPAHPSDDHRSVKGYTDNANVVVILLSLAIKNGSSTNRSIAAAERSTHFK
jgi:hypothetical protein